MYPVASNPFPAFTPPPSAQNGSRPVYFGKAADSFVGQQAPNAGKSRFEPFTILASLCGCCCLLPILLVAGIGFGVSRIFK